MKRLAIFSPGGIGAGSFSQGLPAIATIVRRLSAQFDVTFYSLHPIDPGFKSDGYRIYSAPTSSLLGANEVAKKVRWLALAVRFLIDHIKTPYHATLSFWGYPMGTVGVTLSRLVRIPSIVILLGAETADVPHLRYGHLGVNRRRRLVMWTCSHASTLICVSKSQLDVLRAQGLEREDAAVIPFGAEAELFPFERKVPGEILKILHVANLTEVKDQETLLRAFALLSKGTRATLRIVGADALDGAMQRLARDLNVGESVEFLGALPFAEMPAQYRWADLFILTSLSEGQNRSLTEAAMCGVLQVSTPVGNIIDLGDDVAVVVNVGDPVDVAQKVTAILKDRPAWDRKVANARHWADSHSMAWTVAQLSRIVDAISLPAKQSPP